LASIKLYDDKYTTLNYIKLNKELELMNLVNLDLNKHNIDLVSELIYETDISLFTTFLDEDRIKAIEKLKNLIIAGKNSYGHQHIYIGEDDSEEIIGIIIAFRGDEIKFLEEVKIFMDTMKFMNFLKLTFIKPIYDKITASSIRSDDFYIGNLVVANGLRGQGIGTELIKSSFQIAIDKKCKRILLDVIFENHNAKRLYERIGFIVCGVKKFKWMGKSEGTYGMEYLLG
jgi:ribosomal protein S18 acetylase RimI-like enzyme